MSTGKPGASALGTAGAVWGIVGLSMIIGRGFFSVWPYTMELIGTSFTWARWTALGASLIFMGYAEGYKGFQLKFAPRVAARALYLKSNATPLRVVFAPFFCMGFFHATRKRKIVAYSVTTMVVLLIVGVRQLPQPWRGIVDLGVVLGLAWGVISLLAFTWQAFTGDSFAHSPETPDS